MNEFYYVLTLEKKITKQLVGLFQFSLVNISFVLPNLFAEMGNNFQSGDLYNSQYNSLFNSCNVIIISKRLKY